MTAIVEHIADYLAERLEQTAGVSEVIRPKTRDPFTPTHKQIVMHQSEVEQVPELHLPGSPACLAYSVVFMCSLHILLSEASATAVEQESNDFLADAVKAATTAASNDSQPWHTFNGLAIDTQILGQQPIEADDVNGVVLPIRVIYRVQETDPTKLRSGTPTILEYTFA